MCRHLIFIKILFISFMYERISSLEDTTKYLIDVDKVYSLSENEDLVRVENGLSQLLERSPIAVVLELRNPLLENVKNIWEDNKTDFSIRKTVLATFDSRGLQDRIVFNETSKFLQAIANLEPSDNEGENLIPIMHILNELVQKNLSNGSLLLVTMSKPLDEDFGNVLAESLLGKRCQLSVIWAGDRNSNDYAQLKELASRTGGKFGFISDEVDVEKSIGGTYSQKFDLKSNPLPTENGNNISGRIRFPAAEERETEGVLGSRAAEQKIFGKITPPLIIEVESGTNLEVRPGSPSQIPFVVKNNFNVPIPVFFSAKFNGIPQNVNPHNALLHPSASVRVTINLNTFGNAQTNAVGTVTLFALAANKFSTRSAFIFLSPQITNDKTAPKIEYRYEGDCSNYKDPQNCENGHWGLEATIQDDDSGLLKISSEPVGLLIPPDFIAGTKSPVSVYYSATCCQAKIDMWAEDLRGNYMKKSFDVFNQNLLAGEIAAIVVGVLLLVLIILAIIAVIVLIKRRNRRNMIIPRARSGSR